MGIADSSTKKPAIRFEASRFPNDAYREAFTEDALLREHWQALATAFGAIPVDVLGQRQERVRRMRHEDGATYNLFDNAGERGTPWELDMIPVPFSACEWADLEAGILQRAGLLKRILADIYGPQEMLRQGHLPAELIFANPNFLRPCHGIIPAGNRYLPYYAADLYRDVDGALQGDSRLCRQPGRNGLCAGKPDRHLQGFLRTVPSKTHSAAGPLLSDLSPGPDRTGSRGKRRSGNRVAFSRAGEPHSISNTPLLSRYLGYPLVEGQDLTVRNGKIFLKKLAGLEPVETIFRHICDHASDPFTLRRENGNGVAGMIQACRDQQVDVANPVGSGFVDTPVAVALFTPTVPPIAGRETLPGKPSRLVVRYGGPPKARPFPPESMGRPVGHGADGEADSEPPGRSHRHGTAPVHGPSANPSGSGALMESGRDRFPLRSFRVFACAYRDGFTLMPAAWPSPLPMRPL